VYYFADTGKQSCRRYDCFAEFMAKSLAETMQVLVKISKSVSRCLIGYLT